MHFVERLSIKEIHRLSETGREFVRARERG
jgi:hypothetical protein